MGKKQLGKSAQEVLQQIQDKGYLNPFKGSGKKLFAIGINYNKESKEIDGFEWEEVSVRFKLNKQ